MTTAEHTRLAQSRSPRTPWKKWGPYLSERQWGTVREDDSHDGSAWNSFPHDHARSRAYKWGEDGIAGYCDDEQRLCFSLALWNGHDPILKERLFGLTNSEGNHGEDVKECYFYEDSTPTHSWMRYRYMYPHRAYPYNDLVATNRSRSRNDPEYELTDTGVFSENRYFDVAVEFAKAAPDDTCIRISITNRGPEPAPIHVLPHLWFRNEWWMTPADRTADQPPPRPTLRQLLRTDDLTVIAAEHPTLGQMFLSCDAGPELLFTENETNTQRLWNKPNAQPYVKDAINDTVVLAQKNRVNPAKTGTKAAAHFTLTIPPGAERTLRLRLSPTRPSPSAHPFADFDDVMTARKQEADEFYREVIPSSLSPERANVMRQALAGMLWSKQFFFYDVDRWLDDRHSNPLSGGRGHARNREWFHMLNRHVISMPDKWEFPWYAAWDLAFHVLPLQLVDPDFAKGQLALMLDENYMHPSGQIPAYEWNFSDVNPPVHAWATQFLHRMSLLRGEEPDLDFLRASFNRLTQNFQWWVNRKDPDGNNLFSGGFLGLDNIGIFDRSAPLPTGGHLQQADGTAWMGFYSQCMLQMALELAKTDPSLESYVAKYIEHSLWIAVALDRPPHEGGLWDEQDGFYYDALVYPDGRSEHLKVRSVVGLLPLAASTVFPAGALDAMPAVIERIRAVTGRHAPLMSNLHPIAQPGVLGRHLLSVVTTDKLRRLLARMLDENQFLSPYGIRSLSKEHAEKPYVLHAGGAHYSISYQPGESLTGDFGGNSNWRGPVWMPMNALLIRALINLYMYYGDSFTVECPTGSGKHMTLYHVAHEIARRAERLFLPGKDARRPVTGPISQYKDDPAWHNLVLFHEYYHADTGQGLGASHQTGWSGVIAALTDFFERFTPAALLADHPTLRTPTRPTTRAA